MRGLIDRDRLIKYGSVGVVPDSHFDLIRHVRGGAGGDQDVGQLTPVGGPPSGKKMGTVWKLREARAGSAVDVDRMDAGTLG